MATLAEFRPTKADPWDARKVGHLLNRAGFGGTPEEIERLAGMGPEAAVRDVVQFERVIDQYPPPSWVTSPPETPVVRQQAMAPGQAMSPPGAAMAPGAMQMLLRDQRQEMEELRSWWLGRMVATSRPLQEKLTLFWHGHFATEARKVRLPQLMLEQNELFRTHAAGNFRKLVLEVSRNPAMLHYLDNDTNRKEHPNENYARELMELFTMGIGNYTEQDVKAAARAFTGWTLGVPPVVRAGTNGLGFTPRTDRLLVVKPVFVFLRQFHDDGDKHFLGRTGDFDGEQIVHILFEQPATAKFLCGKLYAFFVSDDPPPPGVVEALAATLRENDYELKPVLEALFRSAAFYDDRVIGAQIKSPVQLVAQAMRQLKATVEPPMLLTASLRQMGQTPLDPPNVKGWDGGRAWITTQTLMARYDFASFLVNGTLPRGMGPRRGPGGFGGPFAGRDVRFEIRIDASALVPAEMRRSPESMVNEIARRLLSVPPDPDQRAKLIDYAKKPADDPEAQVKGLAHLLMSSPNYQLC